MKFRPNYLYAFISMTLVLFLTGIFGSILLQSQQLVRLFKERIMIMVELERGYPSHEAKELERALGQEAYVKPLSVDYISKADAAVILQEDFGSEVDLSEFNLVNPLYDVITFHVKSEYMNQEHLDTIARALERLPIVSAVTYESQVAESLSSYWHRVGWMGLAVSLALVALASFLIIYAVRQALYADRFLIKNMHMVGATPAFIQRPYAIQALAGGILSALAAGVGLLLLRWWLVAQMPNFGELFTLGSWGLIFLAMLLMGISAALGSTWLTVQRYLKSDVNELY